MAMTTMKRAAGTIVAIAIGLSRIPTRMIP